ncbi:BLUF domain-containing protein [Psychrobacter sp. 72-O-c]|uniref:BLUF domain-containing protein n=1 Tax=Psychrobacter sp. 72-O-c TaxID=2774125 RepID=UPI00191A309A|nr:BLUF domain-containing protein [Psychrobacter sp. 72-O-c]
MQPAELSENDNGNMLHGEHIILRLTYISRYNTNNPNGEVTRILAQAQENNEHNGITGALVFNHNYFLQSIEGARPIINELLRKLTKDDRHFALQVIECCEVEQRRWNKWTMKYLIPSDMNKEQALKFSTGTEFNPYLMNTAQIMMLIETLSKLQEQEEEEERTSKVKKSWFSFS